MATEASTPAGTRLRALIARAGEGLPGLGAAVAVAAAATLLGPVTSPVGPPVVAMLLGLALSSRVASVAAFHSGLRIASRPVLQLAIVLLGATLDLRDIAGTGGALLPVIAGTSAAVALGAIVLGRWLRTRRALRLLIGVGTGICGVSAIGAISSVLRLRREDVAYAVAVILTFNLTAVLALPLAGHALHLSADAFGLWAGTAVNDTSSVLAAASAYGREAIDHAVVSKLTRTLLIVPLLAGAAALTWRSAGDRSPQPREARSATWRAMPWFILWFLAASLLNTLGAVPDAAVGALDDGAAFAIAVALAGVGLSTSLPTLRSLGLRPFLLGGLLWVIIAGTSLAIQAAIGLA